MSNYGPIAATLALCMLPALAGATGEPGVTGSSGSTIGKEEAPVAEMSVTVKSPHVRRSLKLTAAGLVTTSFTAGATGVDLISRATEGEGFVTINGRTYAFGARTGLAFRYVRHTVTRLPNGGQKLEVVFAGPVDLPQGLTVTLVYEAPGAAPVLVKRIRIDNDSSTAVRVDDVEVECISPAKSPKTTLDIQDDFVRDAVKQDTSASPAVTRLRYPVSLDRWLVPGARFNSFRVFEFALPSDPYLHGLAFRRAIRSLFPWTNDRCLMVVIASARKDVQEYYRAVDQAVDVGMETVVLGLAIPLVSPLFTNFGDYALRPELFPNGWADVKKLTDYAHSKGIKVGFYTIYDVLWDHDKCKVYTDNKWRTQYEPGVSSPWPGNMDPATDWGLFVNRKIEETVQLGGFDMVMLDGPYYGDVSLNAEAGFKPGHNQFLAWERQTELYQKMRAMGVYVDAAQAFNALAVGLNRVATSGYDEAEFISHDVRSQIMVTRRQAYRFTQTNNPEQGQFWAPVEGWLDGPTMLPMEEHAAEFNAYLADFCGYGFEGSLFTRDIYGGPKTRAIALRWVGFWKDHADFFKKGFILHAVEPDGKRVDAVIHVLEQNGRRRALLVAYNPTDNPQSAELDLSVLKMVKWPLSGWVARSEKGQTQKVSNGKITVSVPAFDATWYEIERD